MRYKKQLDRIICKLELAREVDKEFTRSFGAEHHRYKLLEPLTEEQMSEFEQTYSVRIPEDYRAFLMYVGQGGYGGLELGAGPAYGLYSLDEVYKLADNPKRQFSLPVKFSPEMTDEAWEALTEFYPTTPEPGDLAFDVFGGVLHLGYAGCALLFGLVLNGVHSGRVVYLNLDRSKPQFAPQLNFLDWYENWLDETLSEFIS